MIGVCQKRHQEEFCFVIKPGANDRKSHLIRLEKESMIKEMFFVTNYHILVQFKKEVIPYKDSRNMIQASVLDSPDY